MEWAVGRGSKAGEGTRGKKPRESNSLPRRPSPGAFSSGSAPRPFPSSARQPAAASPLQSRKSLPSRLPRPPQGQKASPVSRALVRDALRGPPGAHPGVRRGREGRQRRAGGGRGAAKTGPRKSRSTGNLRATSHENLAGGSSKGASPGGRRRGDPEEDSGVQDPVLFPFTLGPRRVPPSGRRPRWLARARAGGWCRVREGR